MDHSKILMMQCFTGPLCQARSRILAPFEKTRRIVVGTISHDDKNHPSSKSAVSTRYSSTSSLSTEFLNAESPASKVQGLPQC